MSAEARIRGRQVRREGTVALFSGEGRPEEHPAVASAWSWHEMVCWQWRVQGRTAARGPENCPPRAAGSIGRACAKHKRTRDGGWARDRGLWVAPAHTRPAGCDRGWSLGRRSWEGHIWQRGRPSGAVWCLGAAGGEGRDRVCPHLVVLPSGDGGGWVVVAQGSRLHVRRTGGATGHGASVHPGEERETGREAKPKVCACAMVDEVPLLIPRGHRLMSDGGRLEG